MTDGKLPLAGVRVADFTWLGAGPIFTQVLANFGAEVIRIESELRLDSLRLSQPQPKDRSGVNLSGYFNNFNASKLSLTINMQAPEGREIARQLVAVSDIVAENFRPGTMEDWGLGYDDLREIKQDIIFVREPMAGLEGPQRDFAGYGAMIQRISGLAHLTGSPDRPPVGTGTNYSDFVVNPAHALFATLCALRYRNRTGSGQLVELSQYESSVSVIAPAILDFTANGRVQERQGNRSPYASPHAVYRCLGDDRWVAIAVFSEDQWQALCDAMGRPEWASDERLSTLLGRKANEQELDGLIEAWTRGQEAEDVMERLQVVGVPAGVVQNGQDVLDRDPHLKVRGYYQYLEHPEAGVIAHDGPPFRLSRTPGRVRATAPLLGQHTEYVCKEVLRLGDEEIAELLVAGALQ